MLQVQPEGGILAGYPFALNDIAVLKRDDASMISIRTQVDGEFLVTYQADGLIVPRLRVLPPTTSQMAEPIIIPQSGSFCLTPVAPHSLNIRPIVINDTAEIVLDVESRSHNYLVAIDWPQRAYDGADPPHHPQGTACHQDSEAAQPALLLHTSRKVNVGC